MAKKNKLSRKDQAILMTHIGEMMSNGFSIIQSLDFLETVYPKYRNRIHKLIKRLQNGEALTTALNELGISHTIIDQLEISYAHGNLQESFISFGKMLQYRNEQMKKIIQLLTYPLFLLLMLFFLQVGLKTAGFQTIVGSSDHTMERMINFSMLFLIFTALICIFFLFFLTRKPVAKQVLILSRIPLIGKTILQYYHYLIMFDLTIFVKNGFSINQMIAVCKKRPRKSYLYQISHQIEREIINGTNIIVILRKHSYFPAELSHILGRGMEMDHLKIEFEALTKIIYSRLIKGIENIINKIQPTMFLFVGICVVVVYLNIMLPIFQMMKGIE